MLIRSGTVDIHMLKKAGVAAVLLTVIMPAAAYRWTAAELKAVPQYCEVRFALGTSNIAWQNWAKRFGPASIHMHHYCDGLLWMNRYAKTFNKHEQKGILRSAYDSFMYMVPRVDASWPLRGELYYNLGRVHALRGQNLEALKAFRQSIEYDPKQAASYLAAATLLDKLGVKKQALSLVSEGLRYLPEDKQLRQWYQRLGGEPPYPEPIAVDRGSDVSKLAEPSTGILDPGQPPTDERVSKPLEGTGDEAQATVLPAKPTPQPTMPNNGNTWCRFCPVKP